MRDISISEALCYWDCQKKWDLAYNKKIKKSSKYLEFGSMAHKVLETRKIPEEMLYPDLKEAFGISSWKNYFENIFKNLDDFLKDYDVLEREKYIKFNNIKGVIDVVCKHKDTGQIYLYDYKFKSEPNSYEDLFLNSQLKIYAYLYSSVKWTSYDDIYVGYISIPRIELKPPETLKNGSLSKAKTQNTSYDLYKKTIEEKGLKIEDYVDILETLKTKQYISEIHSSVNEEDINKLISDMNFVLKDMDKGYVLEPHDSRKCKSCEYLKECKYKGE